MRNHKRILGLAVLASGVLVAGLSPARAGSTDDAKYTILLLKYDGPNRIKKSKKDIEDLKAATGLKDIWKIDDELITYVYYGKYKTIESLDDKDEADRAKRDLQRLVNVQYMGERPFRGAFFMPIPLPDPEANPAWDLKNANGVYSLQIAAYKDSAQRKQAAVDAVKAARAMGLEAYYFHGPTTSSVLLGAFPESALKEINPEAKARPDQELLSLPYIPKGMPDEVKNADGTSTKLVEHRVEVTDPQLMALMKHPDYRYHAVNGVLQKLPNGEFAPSFIVDIREVKKQSMLTDPTMAQRQEENIPSAEQFAPRPSTPGAGKLRSVGN